MVQKTEIDCTGYKLIDRGSRYEFHFAYGIFHGTIEQVCTYAVMRHGFSIYELELGILEMDQNFENTAEFGLMRTFMFTYDTDVVLAS